VDLSSETPPHSFAVELWSAGSSAPGSLMATLVDAGTPPPSAPGTAIYVPSTTVTLAAGTSYWIVLKDTATGSYTWAASSSPSVSGPGTIGGTSASFDSGSSWSPEATGSSALFSVHGTVVPEPQAFALATGVSLLALAIWRAPRRDSRVRR
jgi:hypothetical protein